MFKHAFSILLGKPFWCSSGLSYNKANLLNSNMIGQKKINSYFVTTESKRGRAASENQSGCLPAEQGNRCPSTGEPVLDMETRKRRIESTGDTVAVVAAKVSKSILASDISSNREANKLPAAQEDDSVRVCSVASTQPAYVPVVDGQTNRLISDIGPSWFRALQHEFSKDYFVQIKVVILGQDPYHGQGQAHGLCFSVPKGVPPPPSLVNMYKELSTDIPGFVSPAHGDLTGWAQQGVLLLNSVLTVREKTPNSHKDRGWETFTDAVISWLDKNTSGTVFLLWGSYAKKKGARINKKKHHVIEGVHPSPLSAYQGFFGCKHFSKCNEFLQKQGKRPVDWACLN